MVVGAVDERMGEGDRNESSSVVVVDVVDTEDVLLV